MEIRKYGDAIQRGGLAIISATNSQGVTPTNTKNVPTIKAVPTARLIDPPTN
jgi:hypothetical protein